jgi:hypothetical protein
VNTQSTDNHVASGDTYLVGQLVEKVVLSDALKSLIVFKFFNIPGAWTEFGGHLL